MAPGYHGHLAEIMYKRLVLKKFQKDLFKLRRAPSHDSFLLELQKAWCACVAKGDPLVPPRNSLELLGVDVPARLWVGSPAGLEGDPIRGRARTEGDAEYTVCQPDRASDRPTAEGRREIRSAGGLGPRGSSGGGAVRSGVGRKQLPPVPPGAGAPDTTTPRAADRRSAQDSPPNGIPSPTDLSSWNTHLWQN
ncbi:hypothetical protein Bbelb_030480, partial [Branchiostoma belcheri]